MARAMSLGKMLFCAGALVAGMNLPATSFAATPSGCVFGVWMINEQMTKRIRPQRGLMVFLAPWGDNGWVRVSGISGVDVPGRQSAEFHFITWDAKVYPIFGSDPRYTTVKKTGDFTFESSSIREDEPERNGRATEISFSNDCKRSTWVSEIEPERGGGPDRKDIRVYDKILAQTPATNALYYGAWTLNRQASKLTRPPMDAETVVLVPGGNNGWAQLTISGSYQPDDFKAKTKIPLQPEKRPQLEMYWATWDGKPAFTVGSDPGQVVLRKIDDRRFDIAFNRIHQPWQAGDKSSIVFSDDGKRMTLTRSGLTVDGAAFQNDIRVYQRVEQADWPGDVRIPR
jgi:hypothetical protein